MTDKPDRYTVADATHLLADLIQAERCMLGATLIHCDPWQAEQLVAAMEGVVDRSKDSHGHINYTGHLLGTRRWLVVDQPAAVNAEAIANVIREHMTPAVW